jgi:mevalonate kinase
MVADTEGVSLQPNLTTMVSAIAANHKLLQHIGVVPKTVSNFIAEVESKGGAAKICGAGSIDGDHAGLVFVVGLELDHMQKLCLNYAYEMQEMLPDLEGVVYFD